MTRILIDKNVSMPMRDGVRLRGNIYRPDQEAPIPAILVRTPYGKEGPLVQTFSIDAVRAAEAGYAVIHQDTRGRFDSEGDFYPYRYEVDDGYDSVEWVAAQPWCSGPVGMTGLSYLGAVQWMAAIARPPHLKALIPIAIGSGHYMDVMAYQGGAFKAGYLIWWACLFVLPDTIGKMIARGQATPADLTKVLRAADDIDEHVRYLPLGELPLFREKKLAPYFFDWMERHTEDQQPATIRDHYGSIEVPALNVSGWYDYFLDGTLENFTRMQNEGATENARTRQKLIVGPWDHVLGSAGAGFDFGLAASRLGADFDGLQLRYFDHHLKGEANGVDQDAPVRLYVMGENVWRDEQEWPLARTRYERWYLHGDGNAAGAGGRLSPQAPTDTETGDDSYVYDPRHPAPTVGGAVGLPNLLIGANVGYQDQRPIETRSDTLVYTSAPLEQPLEVTGPLSFQLHAASSTPDTDFMVRLCDVHPDGSSRIIAGGAIRARYRRGYDQPELIQPGKVYEYGIDLVATGNLFKTGHCVRVHITSSSFPFIKPNANTGKPIGEDAPADPRPALQTIYHTPAHPSSIRLPVIPR